jgi:leucyl aminopeptidase (aminopeptidase T)
MSESLDRLAHAVLAENLKVRRGESVLLECWPYSIPYARAFVNEARRLGARPTVLYEDEEAWWREVDAKRYGGFASLSPPERSAVASADVFVHFYGPEDRGRMSLLPDKVRERITGYNEEWYRVARKAGLRGCRMSIGQATDSAAAMFGLDGPTWRQRLIEAGCASTKTMSTKGTALVSKIRKGKELTIRHPNGTDLSMRLTGAKVRLDVGLVNAEERKRPYGMLANNPTGQIFVGLNASDANGTFVSNRPVYVGYNRSGGMRWSFSNGRITELSCSEGKEEFMKAYNAAPKGKDRMGYLSLGLNPGAREVAPCEDTEEGAALIGIGGNSFFGGNVKIPFTGFALIGEATIQIDGKTVAQGGRVL